MRLLYLEPNVPHSWGFLRQWSGFRFSSARTKARKMTEQREPRPLRDWLECHPWTTIYIAVVVTILLILQLVELTN